MPVVAFGWRCSDKLSDPTGHCKAVGVMLGLQCGELSEKLVRKKQRDSDTSG